MKIDWDKQPADFPLWLEGTNEEHRKHSGWYRRSGEVFEGVHGGQWRACREGQFFTVHSKPESSLLTGEWLPELESTVRIVPGSTMIWDVAEQFVGVDCTLKAIFMTGDTQMFAVECIESGQCCCFWASMVRTPEQAKTEERAERIAEIAECMAEYKEVDTPNEKMMSLSTYLHDHGCRMAVKP